MVPSARERKGIWAAAGMQVSGEEHVNAQSLFDQRNLCLNVAFLRQLEKSVITKSVSPKHSPSLKNLQTKFLGFSKPGLLSLHLLSLQLFFFHEIIPFLFESNHALFIYPCHSESKYLPSDKSFPDWNVLCYLVIPCIESVPYLLIFLVALLWILYPAILN